MEQATAQVPLAEALKRTKTKPKMWRDLVEAKLIEPARRTKQGRGYEIPAEQHARLQRIGAVRNRLSGRFTIGKLAFALANDGDRSVPVALLRSELHRRVDKFFGFARRTGQRFFGLSPKVGRVTETEIYAAAKKFANRTTKNMPITKRSPANSACWLFTSIFLKMMYLKEPNPLDESRGVKELLVRTGSVDHPDKGPVGFSFAKALQLATQIVATFSGLWRFLTIDKSANMLYKGIGNGSDDDFWKSFTAARLLAKAVWWFYARLQREIRLPTLSAAESAKIEPLFLATILALQSDPPKDPEPLNELLAGSDRGLRNLLGQLLNAIRLFLKLQPLLDAVRRK